MDYRTVLFTVDGGVATVTINRPERLNSFNQQMCEEFEDIWRIIRGDDEIRSVALRAAGDRAFSTGLDTKDGIDVPDNPWSFRSPGAMLGPKQNHVWKPVICALHAMVAGGAFFWVIESDIVICADNTQFFDPHVSYGMVSAIEPVGLARRIPRGEVARMTLLGLDERLSAQRAHTIGLVSEVVPLETLWDRADQLARKIAAKPPAAVQGSVKAMWDAVRVGDPVGQDGGVPYVQIGNVIGQAQSAASSDERAQWELR